jgi:signal transduction histidine kinase
VETEGTGLGLYMVKQIVARMDGRVWCESQEGAGSTFVIEWPAVHEPGGVAAQAGDAGEVAS